MARKKKSIKKLERNLVPHHYPTRIWYYGIVGPEGEIVEKHGRLDEAQLSLRNSKRFSKEKGFRCDSFLKILKDR